MHMRICQEETQCAVGRKPVGWDLHGEKTRSPGGNSNRAGTSRLRYPHRRRADLPFRSVLNKNNRKNNRLNSSVCVPTKDRSAVNHCCEGCACLLPSPPPHSAKARKGLCAVKGCDGEEGATKVDASPAGDVLLENSAPACDRLRDGGCKEAEGQPRSPFVHQGGCGIWVEFTGQRWPCVVATATMM